jgi:hypothetical protein
MNATLTIQEFDAWLKSEQQEDNQLLTALRDLLQLADPEEMRKILGGERANAGWGAWK